MSINEEYAFGITVVNLGMSISMLILCVRNYINKLYPYAWHCGAVAIGCFGICLRSYVQFYIEHKFPSETVMWINFLAVSFIWSGFIGFNIKYNDMPALHKAVHEKDEKISR